MSPVRSAPAATDRLAPKRSANSSAAQQHLRSTGLPGQIDHIIAYCGAASLLGLGYPAANSRFGTIVMLISLAATLEVAQRWIPGRHPQFIDFAASVTGTCLGMLAASHRSCGPAFALTFGWWQRNVAPERLRGVLAILSRKARSTKRPPPIAATTAAACRLTRRPRRRAKLFERAAGFGFAAQAHLRTDRIGAHRQTDRSGHAGQGVFLLN